MGRVGSGLGFPIVHLGRELNERVPLRTLEIDVQQESRVQEPCKINRDQPVRRVVLWNGTQVEDLPNANLSNNIRRTAKRRQYFLLTPGRGQVQQGAGVPDQVGRDGHVSFSVGPTGT